MLVHLVRKFWGTCHCAFAPLHDATLAVSEVSCDRSRTGSCPHHAHRCCPDPREVFACGVCHFHILGDSKVLNHYDLLTQLYKECRMDEDSLASRCLCP